MGSLFQCLHYKPRARAQRMLVEIGKTFRIRVLKLRGGKKGALGKAVTEALEFWIKEHPGNS